VFGRCCLLGLSCPQLLLPEVDPVTLLNTNAPGCWSRSPETLNNIILCPCLSMAADLACPCPVLCPPQPTYPDGLLRYTMSANTFGRVSNLEQCHLRNELLNQSGLSLCNSPTKWPVPLSIFPNNPSQFLSSGDFFLTSGQQSDIRAQLKEEMVPDGHLQNGLLMYPVAPGCRVLDANQTMPMGSISDGEDQERLKSSFWASFPESRVCAGKGEYTLKKLTFQVFRFSGLISGSWPIGSLDSERVQKVWQECLGHGVPTVTECV